MAISVPRLSDSQMTVLADLPEPSGRNKRSYDKLVDAGLVFRVGDNYKRKDDGETVLQMLRDQGLVPELEVPLPGEEPTQTPQPEPEPEVVPPAPRVQRTVTIHGPYKNGEVSYHVHAAGDPANDAEDEAPAETIEVFSQEDVVDHIYPADQFEREPDDLDTYLSDVSFGPSLDELPQQAAEEPEPEEGGEQMADPDQQKQALEVYRKTSSMRAVGRALGIHPTTAKKLVEAAAAVEAASKPAPRGRASGNANAPAPGAKRMCHYEGHEGENPLPFEDDTHFALRKGGPRVGTAVGWCRACNSAFGKSYRERKMKEAQDAA